MSAQQQSWDVYRGEDVSIVLTGTGNTNPTGYALLVTVKELSGAQVLSSTTVTVGGAGPYTLTVALTRAQTSALIKKQYLLDLWRTDAGSNLRLAGGTLTVNTPQRPPA